MKMYFWPHNYQNFVLKNAGQFFIQARFPNLEVQVVK